MPLFSHMEVTRSSFKSLRVYISNSFHIPIKSISRVVFHAILLSLIIAGFWLMDSLKDPVLARIVGIEYQPVAKVISVVVTLAVTCVYDFLTSRLSKANLFHLVSVTFGVIFMIVSALLADGEAVRVRAGDGGDGGVRCWTARSLIAYGRRSRRICRTRR